MLTIILLDGSIALSRILFYKQKEVKILINTLELEVAIKRAKLSKKAVANKLNISAMGLYKKINNITEFKVSEMISLANILSLNKETKEVIFFSEKVEYNSTHGVGNVT